MKRIVVPAILVIVTVFQSGWKTVHDTSEVEQAVMDAERHWEEALKRFDPESMQLLLAEDDLQTDFKGVVQDKTSWLHDFKSVSAAVQSGNTQWEISFEDEKLRVFGNAAVVTGQGTFNGKRKGSPVNHVIRFTNVWAKRRGAWKLVNYQATPIQPR